MPSTRVTLAFTMPNAVGTESQSTPRDRFWADLTSAIGRREPVSLAPLDLYEAGVFSRFGDELKRRVSERLGGTSGAGEDLYFKLIQIRYGSALLDLDIFGLRPLLKAAGVNEEFFVEVLERYSPDALVASAYGPGTTSAGTGLSVSAQSRTPGEASMSKGSRLLQSLSTSLLVPVLLALLVCYVAFVEIHDEKVRYLEQNKVLMDHYQSEIDSLSRRLQHEESRTGPPIFIPGAPGGTNPPSGIPVPPPTPHTGAWIFIGDALLLGALAMLFIWGKKTWAKVAALLLALGGAVTHEYVHIEIKSFEIELSGLFGPRNKPDGGQKGTPASAPLGPELLMEVQGFVTGDPSVPGKDVSGTDTSTAVQRVCSAWKLHNPRGENLGLVLVVGGTDVMKMSGPKGIRFESNFGLAQARAEAVKTRIVQCGIKESNVLAMVFGPQHTPDLTGKKPPKDGYPEDRRVQVWALWAWPGGGDFSPERILSGPHS
jgi:hypothetical protein